MKIQKITLLQNYNLLNSNKDIKKDHKETAGSAAYSTIPYYNDIAFQGRVDKGLMRFYEANVDRMPTTVRNFIEKMPDKSIMSPLKAVAASFAGIIGAKTIDEIKTAYPREELFNELKNPEDTKATRGILGVYRLYSDELKEMGIDFLANGENLSVWLVKKIFLESKHLEEINEDFEREANPDFLAQYRHNEDGIPIRPSTLKALGVKMPDSSYMQSLRYTRDGYSDLVGEHITDGLNAYRESLTEEQKMDIARRQVERRINRWHSLSLDDKLEMLLAQDREIQLLKLLEESKSKGNDKTSQEESKSTNEVAKPESVQEASSEKYVRKEKINTGLHFDDEIYSAWAKNHFTIFELTLDEEGKRLLQIKREQNRAAAWAAMTPEEISAYYSKLKAGAEPLRLALMNAWNKNPDILIKMSIFLKKKNVERPDEFLFRSVEYNKYQSDIMTEFWATYPDYTRRWGESLTESHDRVKTAMKDGTYDDLKALILKERSERSKIVKEKVANYKEILSTEEYAKYPDYIKDFIDTYNETLPDTVKALPAEVLKDFFDAAYTDIEKPLVLSWIKTLKGEELDEADEVNIKAIKDTITPKTARMNRALEAATAELLYEKTGDAMVYRIPAAECKMLLSKLSEKEQNIAFTVDNDVLYQLIIPKHDVDTKRLGELYKKYKQDCKDSDIKNYIDKYYLTILAPDNFLLRKIAEEHLFDYLSTFGQSLDIVFKQPNYYPPIVREAFAQKIIGNAPDYLKPIMQDGLLKKCDDFKKEDYLTEIVQVIKRRYNFVPDSLFKPYMSGFTKSLRLGDAHLVREVLRTVSTAEYFNNDSIKYSKILEFPRSALLIDDKLALLTSEQALADCLYNATKEPKVYALTFEELIDVISKLGAVKKANGQEYIVQSKVLKSAFNLKLTRRINTYSLERDNAQYKENILEYLQKVDLESEKVDREQILFSLNTDEENSFLDEYVNKRIDFVLGEHD